MAEIVGTFAAALQLTETAWKLKKLCSDVRNAPEELSDLVEEVTTLADLLADIEQSHAAQYQTVADANSWKRCRKLLETSVTTMRDVTSELESTLRSHKWTGQIRVYLKRDELKKCSDRIERVKTMMIAAQQSYSFALLTQQNALLLKEIRSVTMDQQMNNRIATTSGKLHSPLNALNVSSVDADADASTPMSSNMAVSKVDPKQALQNKQSRAYNFRLPLWIYRKGLSILVEANNSHWGITFRTYNLVSLEADVIANVFLKRWKAVQFMFSEGLASPFDMVAGSDVTLLDFATKNLDHEGCNLLLRYGLGPADTLKSVGDLLETLAHGISYAQRQKGYAERLKRYIPATETLSNFQNTFSVILAAYQDSICLDSESFYDFFYAVLLPSDCVEKMTNELFLSYEALPAIDRATMAMHTESFDARTVSQILGRDQTLRQAFELLYTSGRHSRGHRLLFASVAEKIGLLYESADPASSIVQAWIDILAEIVSFEATKSAIMPFFSGLTPFLISRYTRNRPGVGAAMMLNKTWTAEARIWIQILKDVGCKLERYGRAEKECLGIQRQCSLCRSLSGPRCFCYLKRTPGEFHLGYMTYGSEVDDWAVWIVPQKGEHYEMAATFWNFMENPELYNVPGTFFVAGEDEYESNEPSLNWAQAPCM